jgi:hypothetical protein
VKTGELSVGIARKDREIKKPTGKTGGLDKKMYAD